MMNSIRMAKFKVIKNVKRFEGQDDFRVSQALYRTTYSSSKMSLSLFLSQILKSYKIVCPYPLDIIAKYTRAAVMMQSKSLASPNQL